MKSKVVIFLIVSVLCGFRCHSATLTLEEAVSRARIHSVDARAAVDRFRSAYWQHRSYKATLLPELSFKGTVPGYRRDYNRYQNADGSYSFVRNDNVTLSGSLELSQRIWPTGGTVSVATSLDWMRQFGDYRGNSFLATPVVLTLRQPLFGINDVKWDRRIEPVRYAEARSEFIAETERVAMQAVTDFFELLIAREELVNATQNLENARLMHRAAVAKRDMGQISRNDLLQIELTMLTAESDVTTARSNMSQHGLALASFLDIDPSDSIVPAEPSVPLTTNATYARALDLALERNPLANSIRRRQLEADRDLAQARADRHQISVYAQVGFSGADTRVSPAYTAMRNNTVVEVGISVPILDWGRRRAAVKVAESKVELTRNSLRKEERDFRQDIFVLVERYRNQVDQFRLARRACEVAQQRYDSSVQTFLIGRISMADLSEAQRDKDSARTNLLQQMYLYWYYRYQLRSVTLYDFENESYIDAEFEKLL